MAGNESGSGITVTHFGAIFVIQHPQQQSERVDARIIPSGH